MPKDIDVENIQQQKTDLQTKKQTINYRTGQINKQRKRRRKKKKKKRQTHQWVIC